MVRAAGPAAALPCRDTAHASFAHPLQSADSACRLLLLSAARCCPLHPLAAPLSERVVSEPPPLLVLVQGPPQVGKTSLIRGLVRHYTKQSLADPQGPLTLVTGKRRRITLLECPPDLPGATGQQRQHLPAPAAAGAEVLARPAAHMPRTAAAAAAAVAPGMMDAAKVADLVLLLIDGSFGLEMETFEFLNLLQVSGFPKVMGVLTHLDSFKEPAKLKKAKKALKVRASSKRHSSSSTGMCAMHAAPTRMLPCTLSPHPLPAGRPGSLLVRGV